MRDVVRRGSELAALAGAVCGALIMALTTVDVLRRALTGRGIAGVTEAKETLLVAMVYLAIAYAERTGVHVRLTLVTGRLGGRAAAAVRSLVFVALSLFALWLALETGARAAQSFAVGEKRIGGAQLLWPLWPARIVIVVGVALLTLECLVKCVDNVRALVGGGAQGATGPGTTAEGPALPPL